MNQAELSKAALYATFMQLRGRKINQADLFHELFGEELSVMLIQDLNSFEKVGLLELSIADKQRLKDKYKTLNHLGAKEVYDWLDGKYKFDSACLTD